jgi:hypothetical protein
MFAPSAGVVGVSTMVKAVPSAAVAPVVTEITPFVMLVTTVMLAVVAKVGTPFAPALQPVNVPSSCEQSATAVFAEASSAIAAAARVRDT